jgi:hypothetical protein
MSKQVLVEEGWQCVRCAWFTDEPGPPKLCRDCGCPIVRRVDGLSPRDRPSPDSVAHFKKKVENCWNYNWDPLHGRTYHRLKLIQRVAKSKADPDIPIDRAQVTIREGCKTCGELYHQEIIPLTRSDLLAAYGLQDLAKGR